MALEKANDNPVLEGLALAEIVSYTGPSTDPGPDYLTALPRPPGLAATDGDPVIVGDLDYSGFAPMDEHILDESKSRLRLLAPGSTEPSILGTVSSSEGDSISVDLQKQPNNTHLSAEKIVIYSDSIDGAVVSAINFSENVALVHNQEITGDAKNFHVENGTFTLFINCRVDNGDPNILVAGSQATTKIKFKDRRNRAGVTVKFTTTSGQVSPATAQTDASGNCETVYTASAQASTAKITASIDSGLAASVYVYNAEYDFLNLSNVAGLSGYNDTTFVNNAAMTAAQVQAFLQSRNSFLQNYSENGKTAAAIIKSAADTHQINPRIILVTLQKEQGLVSQTEPLSPTSQRMTKAMGSNLGNTFTTQIDEGCRALRRAFNVQTIPFYKIVTPYKVNASGQRVSSFLTQNHLYVVPSTGVRNVFAAVAFRVANKSTYAQHQFTNYVTHRLDAKASTVNLPAGGVYTFVSVWRSLFP